MHKMERCRNPLFIRSLFPTIYFPEEPVMGEMKSQSLIHQVSVSNLKNCPESKWYGSRGRNSLFIRSLFPTWSGCFHHNRSWKSQSLIHQVSVSNKTYSGEEETTEEKSQSLIHQVSVSNAIWVGGWTRTEKTVAIPYSSGLCFQPLPFEMCIE